MLHGGVAAIVAAYIQSKTEHTDVFFFGVTFWNAVWLQFAANGALRLVQYWRNNPVPDTILDDGTPVQSKVMSINPLSKVEPITKP